MDSPLHAAVEALLRIQAATTPDAVVQVAASGFGDVFGTSAHLVVTKETRRWEGRAGADAAGDVVAIEVPFETPGTQGRVDLGGLELATERRALADQLARAVSAAMARAWQLEQAEAAWAARRDVLEVVTHDLRSPLQTFTFGLGLVEDALGESRRDIVMRMRRNVATMGRLIGDVRVVNRFEEEGLTLTPSRPDLAKLIADLVGELQPEAALDGIQLHAQLDAPSEGADDAKPATSLRVDGARLHDALVRMMAFGVKRSPKGGTVTLAVVPEAGAIRFVVQDGGATLSPEQREKAFDLPGRKAEGQVRGLSLGLYYARCVAVAHGGSAGVDAAEPTGNRYWLRIPSSS